MSSNLGTMNSRSWCVRLKLMTRTYIKRHWREKRYRLWLKKSKKRHWSLIKCRGKIDIASNGTTSTRPSTRTWWKSLRSRSQQKRAFLNSFMTWTSKSNKLLRRTLSAWTRTSPRSSRKLCRMAGQSWDWSRKSRAMNLKFLTLASSRSLHNRSRLVNRSTRASRLKCHSKDRT